MVYNRAQRTMRRKLLLWMAVLLLANVAHAQTHDFSAVAPSGQTLYYKIVDGEARVVRPGSHYEYENYVTGDLTIPSTVSYNGITYTVSALGTEWNDPYGAFERCENLISVVIPNTVTVIGNSSFERCTGLISLSIPSSVVSIKNGAFEECTSLTSITIPNSVTSIGDYAFHDCSSLTSISIPNTVTSIGHHVLSGCSGIGEPVFTNSHFVYMPVSYSGNYMIPSGISTICGGAFSRCCDLVSISIPNSVVSIEYFAFERCGSLTSISLPSGITRIDNGTFQHCNGLVSVSLPNTIVSIGPGAFSFCENLMSISIPNSVSQIEDNAFEYCTSLQSIVIPSSVTTLGSRYNTNSPFVGCSSLVSIVVDPNNPVFDSRNNCNAIIKTGRNYLVAGCKNTSIPSDVVYIGYRSFAECGELNSITIPPSVDTIGNWAFSGCGKLRTLYVPNTVKAIGVGAFSGLNNVMYYGAATGSPWGAKTLNGYVENGLIYTDNSKTVLTGFEGNLGAVDIPTSVDTIGEWALAYSSLTSVTIPRSVKWIGNCALNNCNRLQTVTLNADSCRYDSWHDNGIDMDMNIDLFSGCNNLRTIIIGGNVRYIPRYTIDYSTIDTIISHAEVPPAFWGCRRSEIVMKVPCTALDAYRNTEPWSRLNLYCETEGIEDARDEEYGVYASDGEIVVEGAVREVVSVYDVMGRMVHRWRGDGARRVKKGIYLVRIGESSARKVVVM